jgi:hypothetical protein
MTQWNFSRAKVGLNRLICIACIPDIPEAGESYFPLNVLMRVDAFEPPFDNWFSNDDETVDMSVASIVRFINDEYPTGKFVALSHEGDIFVNAAPYPREKIPTAGIATKGKSYGRVHTIRQIGSRLYVCGENGQVYVRRMPRQWEHLEKSLLHDADEAVKKMQEAPDFAAENERQLQSLLKGEALQLVFYDINGPTEDDIYVVGIAIGHPFQRGRIYHWDGAKVTSFSLRSEDALINIFVETPDRIWVCGRDGQLLMGNARDGFAQQRGIDGDHLFTAMTMLDGAVYLASVGRGLFSYREGVFSRVRTDLVPEISDIFHVEAMDGAIWAVGRRDVIWFDGGRWHRFPHPNNPPVR